MTRHPTNVGCTPENVARFDIKHEFSGSIAAYCIAAMDMYNSLWLTGTTAGVENVEHILAIHRFARNNGILGNIIQQYIQVHIAARSHGYFKPCMPLDKHLFNCRSFGNSFVGNFLELNNFTAAIATIGCNEYFGITVIHAIAQRTGCKPSKHYHVGSPQACAC